MATFTERLAILISADTRGAVREMQALGTASQRNLSVAQASAGGFAASADKAGSAMIAFGARAVAGGAIASAGLFDVAKSAAALGDSVQAADVIFGKDLSASIDRFARDAADKLGMSRREATETLTAFATFGRGAGLQGPELLKFSESLSKVAVDLGSLKGLSTQEVVGAISSGLAGEIEPLRRLGIQITDVQKKAEAVRLGLRKASETTPLTAEQNTLATASLIKSSPLGQAAAGDFERTIDTLPNKLKVAQASFDNLKVSLGTGIVPVFAKIADSAASVARTFEALPEPVRETVGTLVAVAAIGATAGGALSLVGGGLTKLVAPVGNLGKRVADAGGGVSGLASVLAGGLNPAALAATAAIGGGLAIFEAWSSAAKDAEAKTEELRQRLLDLRDAGDVIPTISSELSKALSNDDFSSGLKAAGLQVSDIAARVAAAPGAFDKFRDSVDGALGSLETVGGAGGVLETFAQLVTFQNLDGGINDLRDAAKAAGPTVQGLVTPLLDLVEAGKLTGDQFRAIINETVDFDKRGKEASDTWAAQAQAIRAVAGASAFTGQALADFTTATSDNASVQDKIDALNRLKTAFPQAVEAAGIAATAITDVGNAAAGSSSGLNAGASAAESYAARLQTAVSSIREAADGISNADLFTQATQAAQGPARAALGYESALLRVQQAQEKLNELSDPKKNTDAQESALDRVRSATEGLTDAIERRRKAQEELDRLTRRSAVAGSVPLVQEIARAADQGVKEAQTKVDQALATYGEGSDQVAAARKGLEAAAGRRDQSVGLLNRALEEQGGRNAAEVRAAQRELDSANADIGKAVRDKRKAEEDYSETLVGSRDTVLQRRAAEIELQQATLDLEIATATLTGNIQDGVDPFGELAGALQRARDAGVITDGQFQTLSTTLGVLSTEAQKSLGWMLPLIGALSGATPNPAAEAGGVRIGQRDAYAGSQPLGSVPVTGGGRAPAAPAPAASTGAPQWNPNLGQTPPAGSGWQSIGAQTYQSPMGQVWRWDGRSWIQVAVGGGMIARPGGRIPFAEGGSVPGAGHADSVPAMLTPGEFVVTRQAVGAVGTEALKALNKGQASVQKFATGGVVRGPRPVPAFPSGSSASARTSSGRNVEVNPTFIISATEPRAAADESVRKLRRATFLAGVR